jgi:drug/metabolite transporter (DMT)-like permease
MTAVLFALAASVGWGASDFAGGRATRRLPVRSVLVGSQLIALVAAVPVLAGHATAPESSWHLLVLAPVAGAISVGELGLIYYALGSGRHVITAPIAAISAALPVVVGVATGDRLHTVVWLGLACALAGAATASASRGNGPGDARQRAVGAGIALGAGLGAGAFLILMDDASAVDPWWAVGGVRIGGLVAALAWWAGTRRTAVAGVRSGARVPGLLALLVVAVCDVTADSSYAQATRGGPLSVVAVIGSLYPITTIVLARVLLRQRTAGIQLLGAALACAGVAVLAAAG